VLIDLLLIGKVEVLTLLTINSLVGEGYLRASLTNYHHLLTYGSK